MTVDKTKERGIDRELEEYRSLMEPPEVFKEGFSWKAVIGAIFLGAIMMPAAMYLNLFAGMGGAVNQAARWVTIIIFAEVARRSFKDLEMQEVYILFYMAGLTMAAPFSGLLWRQFFVQSEYTQALGIAQEIPSWWAPSAETIKAGGRTFFTGAWLIPIVFVSFSIVIQKLDHYGLGYALYRLTNDVERLPFPMAPVGASGIVSLTEVKGSREPWRWRCFSIGGMIGMIFGAFYIGVPAITGAILAKPIQLIPIPWVDLTPQLTRFLPATPLNITFDLGAFLVGTVLPFWAVMGGIFGVFFTMVLNPILHHVGVLHNWTPQMGFIDAIYSNHIDFYLSFGIGLTFAIAIVSLIQVINPIMKAIRTRGRSSAIDLAAKKPSAWQTLMTNNVKRGDFSILIALGIYCFTSIVWISVSTWLIPGFPWGFFVVYAAVYVPLISYSTAKLEGICGQALTLPMIREATFILSGYQGVQIWFSPVPIPNYGIHVREFRILELTGTKIKGQIKAQAVTLPIILVSSLIFSTLLWRMAPVPSEAYPFADKMWELQAKMMALTYTSTMEGGSEFMEAWDWGNFSWGMGSGVILYSALSWLGLPVMLVFGMVRGLAESHPGAVLFQGVGALTGRFYLKKRFGNMWLKYAPVILAGFSCGMGLMALISISFSMLTKMMSPLIF